MQKYSLLRQEPDESIYFAIQQAPSPNAMYLVLVQALTFPDSSVLGTLLDVARQTSSIVSTLLTKNVSQVQEEHNISRTRLRKCVHPRDSCATKVIPATESHELLAGLLTIFQASRSFLGAVSPCSSGAHVLQAKHLPEL